VSEDEGPIFPYDVDEDDHCESPQVAYEHILPLLRTLQQNIPHTLRIYDPYFCDGAVIKNLESLGFTDVYNKKEDCYNIWKTPSMYPAFDVLVTNPPYSQDHIQKVSTTTF